MDGVNLSIIDIYHDTARDFGVNLKQNLNIKDADVAFDDEIDVNLPLIKEVTNEE